MANFKTHITGAAAASWVGAVGLHGLDVVPADQVMLLTLTGALGGILPDIDSDNSYPLSIIFFFIYPLVGHAILINGAQQFEFPVLLGLCLLALVSIRLIVFPMFLAWTRHRGILHSIIAALLFGLSTTAVAEQTYKFDPKTSWLLGFFIFYGCVIHLILDELYSVDFSNKRIKKSAGTALKFWYTADERGKINSSIFLILALIAFGFTPSLNALLEMWETAQTGVGELMQAVAGVEDTTTTTKELN